jgi:glyoxylase-like metal-dependent hydrolase (beta-lactamase superfamily II)
MQSFEKLLIALMLAAIQCPLWAAEFPEPEVVRIGERLWVLLGPIQHANDKNQGYMINSTVIIGDQGVVLVDPGGTDEIGRFIKRQVKRITQKPVTHVINTHPHGDHYLGNIAFPEATVISSKKCRELVVQDGDTWVRLMESMVGRHFPNTEPITAHVVYPALSKTKVTLNGINMVMWIPPGSHTAGDLMIYLPDEKVLIAGDILVNGVVPTMQDGIVKNWISVLKEVEQIDADVYVPGHGALMKRDEVESLRNAMTRFYTGVQEGYRAELSESEIREKLDLAAWESLERAYVIGRNINRAYLEVEQDMF